MPDPTFSWPLHGLPSFRLRVSYHPTTRAHVRLLGPCFKTGRESDRRDHRPRARDCKSSADGRPRASTANGTRRATRPAGRPTAAYPPSREGAHGLVTSIRSRTSTHARCNTPAEAWATFARRFWPTSNRSWPARDANALGRYACYTRGGARASTQLPAARLRAQLKASRARTGSPVCLLTVSRTFELSLQSAFQLSLTVLVRYRSRDRI